MRAETGDVECVLSVEGDSTLRRGILLTRSETLRSR